MGNLDFSNQPGFSWYCVLLLVSGIAMLVMVGVPVASKGARIANLIFGVGFLGYALYLIFAFHGVQYVVFFKAFLLPVVLIVGALKSGAAGRAAKNTAPYQPPMVDYGQQNQAPGFVPQQHQGYAQQPYQQQPQAYSQQPQQPYPPQGYAQPQYPQQYQQPQPQLQQPQPQPPQAPSSQY